MLSVLANPSLGALSVLNNPSLSALSVLAIPSLSALSVPANPSLCPPASHTVDDPHPTPSDYTLRPNIKIHDIGECPFPPSEQQNKAKEKNHSPSLLHLSFPLVFLSASISPPLRSVILEGALVSETLRPFDITTMRNAKCYGELTANYIPPDPFLCISCFSHTSCV